MRVNTPFQRKDRKYRIYSNERRNLSSLRRLFEESIYNHGKLFIHNQSFDYTLLIIKLEMNMKMSMLGVTIVVYTSLAIDKISYR